MKFGKISVLVPTRQRLQRLDRFIGSFRNTVGDKANAELIFRVDNDDLDSIHYLSKFDWKVLVGPRLQGYRSLPRFYNDMARIATGDLLACGNDDMVFETKDWPDRILEVANRYSDGMFNLGVNTGLNDDKFPFSIISRHFREALGFINDERLLFSDIFIRDVMDRFDRNIRITNVTFFHDWAGHGEADQTRRDANAHEFDMVFADTAGNWTDAYRQRHETAVQEAVDKITSNSAIQPAIMFANFAQYRPPPGRHPDKRWPPGTTPGLWRGEGKSISMHYHREEILALVDAMFQLPMARRTAVLGSLHNGLPSIFWGQMFDRIITIAEQEQTEEPLHDGKYSVYPGTVGNTKFLYGVIEHVEPIDCLILDHTRYSALISPYFLFRQAMRRPGVIVLFNTADRSIEPNGAMRFVNDLRTGHLDGICHEIRDIAAPGGPGVSYELVI